MNQLEQVRWRVTTDGRLLAAAAGGRVTADGRVTSSRQVRTVVASSSRQVDLSESLVVCISQL